MTMISRVFRWLLRIGVWVLVGVSGLLVLLAIGVALYSRTAHFHHLLHEQILAILHDSFDAEVSFDETSGSIWQGLEIHSLSIQKDGVEVVSVPRAVVSVDLFAQLLAALRTASIQVAKITISDPVVRIVQDPETGWNVARLMKPSPAEEPTAPLPLSILLPQLAIEHGRVSMRLADGKEFQASSITIDGGVALYPTGLHADVKTLQFAVSGADIPDVQWKSQVTYTEESGVSKVQLHSLDLRTAASHLQASGMVNNLAQPEVDLRVTIDNLAAVDVGLIAPPQRLQQDLAGTIGITGPLSDLRVNAALKAPDGRLTSTVTANLSQSPPHVQGTLSVDRFVLQKVLLLPGVLGEVTTARIKFQGATPKTLIGEMSVYVSQLEAAGKKIGDVNMSGVIVNGKASAFTEVNSPAGYAYMRNQLTLGAPLTYETTVMLRKIDARQFTGDASTPRTNVNADVWFSGKGVALKELSSEAKLTIFPSQVGTTAISKGEFVANLRDGRLTVQKGLVLANDAAVSVSGQLGVLQERANGRISYRLTAKNLTPWLALGGLDGKGAIDLAGKAEGSLTALRAEGKLTLTNIVVDDNEVRDGVLTYQFSGVGGQQPKGQVDIAANDVRVGKPFKSVNATITLAGLRPADIQAEVVVRETEERTHRLKTQARYTPEKVDVVIQELALQLPTGTWSIPQPPHFVLQGSRLTVDNFVLQHAEQRISAAGEVDTQGPLNLQLQVERLALEDLRPMLEVEPEIKGRIDARVKVLGTMAKPDVTADVTTGPVTVAEQTYAGLSLQSAYRGEQFSANLLLRQDERHSMQIDGGIPIKLKPGERPALGEARFHVHSDGLSLAFLGLLSREVQDVRGVISMDVSLSGPVQALVPSGSIQLQQGNVYIKKLGQAFSDINVALQLESRRIRLSEFSLRGGEGEFTGKGDIALKQYQIGDIDLTFDAQRFRVIDTEEYRAALSGQVRCSGSLAQPVVTGELTVVDTTLRPNLALLKSGPEAVDPTITVVRTSEELALLSSKAEEERAKNGKGHAPKQDGFYKNVSLDLHVTIPRDTWVQLTEGSIELRGELQARKARGDELALSGTIETVHGWVAVQGRKFRLEKGVVTFTGATPIDPNLDVIARYTLPDYVVDVVIGGTGTAPTVAFRSDPVLEEADILSLLAFGKPANALTDQQKSSLSSQAVQVVAGAVATDLRQVLAEQLGVENLELEVGDNPLQSKVGIGKYIAPGVFVSTTQQFGGGEIQGRDVTIEYQLNDNWQLKASSSARGNNGVDILWKKKY